jgi:putative ABC transport system permease protein
VFVFIMCAFLIIVPVNFLNTIKSPDFIGYTGVGRCDALITLSYSEDMVGRFSALNEALTDDTDISAHAGRITANYKILNADGKLENISIQYGDFSSFPIPYSEGGYPTAIDEIALSLTNANNYGKKVGDVIEIYAGGAPVGLKVCGIYQDLTNGGRSAQAFLPYVTQDVLWYSFMVTFTETADAATKITELSRAYAPAKVVSVDGYLSQTMAGLTRQFESVTLAVAAAAIAVATLITALFLKLLLAKDRAQIVIMKGLGFTSRHIGAQYISAMFLCLAIGVAAGTLAANTLGELLIGLLMGGLGASKISFVINPLVSYALCPLLLLAAVTGTTLITARSIRRCGNYLLSE